jgi:uncharacterized protein YkwD
MAKLVEQSCQAPESSSHHAATSVGSIYAEQHRTRREHSLLQTVLQPQRPSENSEVEGGTPDGSSLAGITDYWFQEDIVSKHNRYRCMHGAPPLAWSWEIEYEAKRWAVMGRQHKSPAWMREGLAGFDLLGENVAVGILNRTGSGSPGWAVDMWYKQMPGHIEEQTAEHIQIVWRNTTSIGCGLRSGFLVCYYGPAGNIDGDVETQVPPLKDGANLCS